MDSFERNRRIRYVEACLERGLINVSSEWDPTRLTYRISLVLDCGYKPSICMYQVVSAREITEFKHEPGYEHRYWRRIAQTFVADLIEYNAETLWRLAHGPTFTNGA